MPGPRRIGGPATGGTLPDYATRRGGGAEGERLPWRLRIEIGFAHNGRNDLRPGSGFERGNARGDGWSLPSGQLHGRICALNGAGTRVVNVLTRVQESDSRPGKPPAHARPVGVTHDMGVPIARRCPMKNVHSPIDNALFSRHSLLAVPLLLARQHKFRYVQTQLEVPRWPQKRRPLRRNL